MGVEVVLFYKDIYNLLSTEQLQPTLQLSILYSNKDYGNVRGLNCI